MRNIDKIRRMEHELGRYQKKVADQTKEVARLRKRVQEADEGVQQTQKAVDALLTAVVLAAGTAVEDQDAPGTETGRRLEVPFYSVEEMLAGYELHARRDEEADVYVLGMTPR